jgi:hypothetical protein
MTTDSGASPHPGDRQEPSTVDPALAAQAGAAETQDPTLADIDEEDLKAAIAAAEAEKAAGGAAEGATPDPGAALTAQPKPAGQPDQATSGGDKPADHVTIPKARFDEVAKQRDDERANAAYWRGVAEARGQQGQRTPQGDPAKPGGTAQGQPPAAEARLAEIQTKQDALAQKFDNGEITYSDLVKESRALNTAEQTIREEMLLAKVKPADARARDDGDGLYMDRLTVELETQHPWCQVFNELKGPEADAAWEFVAKQAQLNMNAAGIDTSTQLGKYELRKEAAKLADKFGPALIGELAKASNITIPGQQSGQPSGQGGQQQKPPLSPLAKARAEKLATAADAPPNLSSMNGNAGDPSGLPTDASIEGMDDDAIGNLPDATRNRLLGLNQS